MQKSHPSGDFGEGRANVPAAPESWPSHMKITVRDMREMQDDPDSFLTAVALLLDWSQSLGLQGEVSNYLETVASPIGDVEIAARLLGMTKEARRIARVLPAQRLSHPNVIYGTPITPRSALERLRGCSFCVSFFAPSQVKDVIRMLGPDSAMLLDNGAYSAWRSGIRMDDQYWEKYWDWAINLLGRVEQAVAVIPDVIDGTAEENMELIVRSMDRVEHYDNRLMPVWHLNEPLDQLREIVHLGFRWIAFGSSGDYAVLGTPAWDARIDEAFAVIESACDHFDELHPRIHMMRGLGQLPRYRHAFYSADSTNVARNHSRQARRGEPIDQFVRRIESARFPVPSRPVWPSSEVDVTAPSRAGQVDLFTAPLVVLAGAHRR